MRPAFEAGLVLSGMEEWHSDKISEPGPRARMTNRARMEFSTLFLALPCRTNPRGYCPHAGHRGSASSAGRSRLPVCQHRGSANQSSIWSQIRTCLTSSAKCLFRNSMSSLRGLWRDLQIAPGCIRDNSCETPADHQPHKHGRRTPQTLQNFASPSVWHLRSLSTWPAATAFFRLYA